MRQFFILITWLTILIQNYQAVDVRINTASNFTFGENILKSQVSIIEGQQFLFILFSNGTISKLDSQLNFRYLIASNLNRLIVDFQILNEPTDASITPSIVALMSSRTQFRIISIINPQIQIPQFVKKNITKVFGLRSSIESYSNFSFNGCYYSQDFLSKYTYTSTNGYSSQFYNSFSYFIVVKITQTVKKVLESKYQSKRYFFSSTSGSRFQLFRYQIPNITQQILHFISNYNWFIDKQSIVVGQDNSNNIKAKNMINGISIGFDNWNFSSKNFNTGTLKGIRPKYETEGDRMFIFNAQIVRVNLTNNNYKTITKTYQTGLPFSTNTNDLEFVTFSSSSNAFIYQKNSNKVYSYCESMQDNFCTNTVNVLPCSIKINYCQTCDSTLLNCQACQTNFNLSNNQCIERCRFTFPYCTSCDADYATCLSCEANYVLLNNTCFQKTPCTNSACKTCILNSYCLQCNTGSLLNVTTNDCTISNNTPPSNTSNSTGPSNTNNSTTGPSNTSNSTTGPSNTTNNTIPEPPNTNTIPGPTNNDTNTPNNTNPNGPTENQTNPTTNQTQPQSNYGQEFTKDIIENILSQYSESIRTLAESTTILNSSPMYRLFLGFLAPVFGLFDDYWFYIYHQNNFQNLQILPRVLVFMYIINGQRILPDYLTMPDDLTLKPFAESQYYENYTSERVLLIDENMTHLQQNLEPLFIEQYFYEFVVFALIACLLKGLKLLNKKPKNLQKKQTTLSIQKSNSLENLKHQKKQNSIIKAILNQVQNNVHKNQNQSNSTNFDSKQNIQKKNPSRKTLILKTLIDYFQDSISFKSIILTLIGANLIFLSFEISLQFGVFFSFKFIDTVNLTFTVFCGMIFIVSFCVILALCQVLLPTVKISKKDCKKEREEKLQEKEDIQNEDFYELVFECIKCVLYGFIHGYFINHNQVQYVLLIMVKIFLISVVVRKQEYFPHRIFSILKILYFSMGIGIDVLCLLSKKRIFGQNVTTDGIGQFSFLLIIQLTMVSLLFLSVLLYVIIDIYFGLRETFCTSEEEKSNKLRPGLFFSILNKIMPINEVKNIETIKMSDSLKKNHFSKEKQLLKPSYRQKHNLKQLCNRKNFILKPSKDKNQILQPDNQEFQNPKTLLRPLPKISLLKQKVDKSLSSGNNQIKYKITKPRKVRFQKNLWMYSLNSNSPSQSQKTPNESISFSQDIEQEVRYNDEVKNSSQIIKQKGIQNGSFFNHESLFKKLKSYRQQTVRNVSRY